MPGRRAARTVLPQALSTDVWYTLLYLPTARRKELHRRRSALWAGPLLRAGWSRARVDRVLAEHARWKEASEASGRTPPLSEQVAWLAQRTNVTIDAPRLAGALDQALLRAPVRAAPGAAATLRRLSREGVPLAVVSNVLNESAVAAREVLDRIGLLRWFRVAYFSSEHPFAKPRPEPFRSVARFLGVVPSELIHVGDLRFDLDGARAAGATPWLFDGFSELNRYLPGRLLANERPRVRHFRSWEELGRAWRSLPNGG